MRGPDPAALPPGKAGRIAVFVQPEPTAQLRIHGGAVFIQGTHVTPINLRGIM